MIDSRADSPADSPRLPGRRAVGILLQLLLTGVVTVLVFRALGGTLEDAMALDRAFASPRVLPLVLASVVLLAGYALAARLWGWMVAELGDPDPGTRVSVQLLLAANLGRYIPGKIWQLAGLAVLARRRGISATGATAASLLVQGFALAATAVWGIPALLSGRAGVAAGAGTGASAGAAGGPAPDFSSGSRSGTPRKRLAPAPRLVPGGSSSTSSYGRCTGRLSFCS